MKNEKTNKGLLVGFTKWQTTKAYPMFKSFFSKYNIELEFQKIDDYVLCVDNNKINLNLNSIWFLHSIG